MEPRNRMDPMERYRAEYASQSQVGYGSGVTEVAQAAPAVRAAFLRKVYMTLTAGVAVSMATAIYMTMGALQSQGHLLWKIVQGRNYLFLFLAYLALAFGAGAVARTRGINVIVYAVFTAFTGFFISPLLLFAVGKTGSFDVVWQALGLTTFAFAGLTGYVLLTKKDFSFIRGFIWTGLFILLGFMVVGFFVQSWAFHMGITAAGILVFVGFILYDTSEIMHRYGPQDWVAGALSLFIDFINMFIRVLSLLANRRG